MNENKNKKKAAILMLSVLAIVMVTVSASYAAFRYSRTSKNINTIKMGNIEFSMLDGDSISLNNKFPVSDEVGNKNDAYTFTVNNTSSEGVNLYYNVSLLTSNTKEDANYFNNEQIKFSLVKNSAYVAETAGNAGRKLSTIDGFTEGTTTGTGIVLSNQVIASQTTDTYELRIWISDDVNYSDSIDENGLSTGKYNEYQYSLKVKVNANDSAMGEYVANNVQYTNSEYTTCSDISCALNELYTRINGE